MINEMETFRKEELNTDVRNKISQKFAEYAALDYENIRKQNEDLIKQGYSTPEKREEMIANRKEMHASLDFGGQVSELTNNFYMWWPNGYYRQMHSDRKKKENPDLKKIEFDEKLISDLDAIIKSKGYESAHDLIQMKNTSGEEREKRAQAIAEVFLEMQSLGYDPKILRR